MPVKTDFTTDHEAAKVSEALTEEDATEIDGPDTAAHAEDTSDSEDIAKSGKSSDATDAEDTENVKSLAPKRRIKWSRVLAFGVLPVLALLIGAAAGFLKWQDSRTRMSAVASIESVGAAKESTVALLSYHPDTVEKDLGAARGLLTGTFKDSYGQLVHDVVIPGAKKQHISAIATVPAATSVSATPHHAVALVFVDQTVTVGNDSPTDTASAVRVTLDKINDRWLISAFDPV